VLSDIIPPDHLDRRKLAIYFTSFVGIISDFKGKDKQFFRSGRERPTSASVEKKKNWVKPGLFGLNLKNKNV